MSAYAIGVASPFEAAAQQLAPLPPQDDGEFDDFGSYTAQVLEAAPKAAEQPACKSLVTPATEPAPGLPGDMLINLVSANQLVAVEQISSSTDALALKEVQSTPLGEGSFGTVFKGTLAAGPQGSVTVVIKTPRGRGDLAALREEARLQALCAQGGNHVVKVYAVCYAAPAILMEYCAGHDLAAVLRALQGTPPCSTGNGAVSPLLPWSSRLQLLQHAASALAHIHDCSVLHNDLRAANCVLVPPGDASSGDSWLLKVTDFGLACELGAGADSSPAAHHTNPLWVAPEVMATCNKATGAKCCTVSKAADVYCFGGLVYEMLTGLPPHYCSAAELSADRPNRKACAILYSACAPKQQAWSLELSEKVELLHLPEVDGRLRAELCALLDRCCTHKVQDRCSAAYLRVWLEAMLAMLPVN